MKKVIRNLLWPQSTAGRVASGLLATFVIGMAIFAAFVASGQRGGDTYWSNMLLALPITTAALAAIVGGFLAIWSIVARHERALVVWLAVLVGALVLLFVSGEILAPH